MAWWKLSLIILSYCLLGNAKDWSSHKQQIKQYKDKVIEAEKNYKAAIAMKNSVSTNSAVQKVLEEITTKKAEWQEAVKKYNRELDHIRFEHPEKGDDSILQYRRIKEGELDTSGELIGIEGTFYRLKKKAREVFKKEEPKELPKEDTSQTDTTQTPIPDVELSY